VTNIRHYTASAVVLDDEGRVLLVHHNKIGMWLYPGGHIDPNEDPAQAALREVVEETGVVASVIGEPAFSHPAVRSHPAPWAIIEMDVVDVKVGAHRHIDAVYVCRATGGDLTAQLEEVAGVRWVTIADVAGLPTPAEMPELVAAAALWAKQQVNAPLDPLAGLTECPVDGCEPDDDGWAHGVHHAQIGDFLLVRESDVRDVAR
jgi:8-oxo-dGTP pyrophosphatase MutT (NUDIX family)